MGPGKWWHDRSLQAIAMAGDGLLIQLGQAAARRRQNQPKLGWKTIASNGDVSASPYGAIRHCLSVPSEEAPRVPIPHHFKCS